MSKNSEQTTIAGGEYEMAEIGRVLVEGGFNNRRQLGDVSELAASIKSVGLLQPLVVRPGNGKTGLWLIAGHRRLEACRQAGLKHVPVRILDLDEAGRLEALLVENLHREGLDPFEEADGYRRLVELGLSQAEVAAKVGRSQAHVSKRLSLMTLSPKAQQALNSGGITLEQAIELGKFEAGIQDQVITNAVKAAEYVRGDLRDKLRRHFDDSYRTPAKEARDLLEKAAISTRKADARKQAKDEGVELLKGAFDDGQYSGSILSSFVWQSHSARPLEHKDLKGKVKLAEHKQLACHRALVTTTGKLVYCCADPASHLPKEEAKSFRKTVRDQGRNPYAEQKAAAEKRKQELAAIAEWRDLQVVAALPKLAEKLALRLVLEDHVENSLGGGYGDAKPGDVARLLGLTIENARGFDKRPLLEYGDQSEANLLRLAVAVSYCSAVATFEAGYGHEAANVVRMLAWLRTIGYEPSKQELEFEQLVLQRGQVVDTPDGGFAYDDAEDDTPENRAELEGELHAAGAEEPLEVAEPTGDHEPLPRATPESTLDSASSGELTSPKRTAEKVRHLTAADLGAEQVGEAIDEPSVGTEVAQAETAELAVDAGPVAEPCSYCGKDLNAAAKVGQGWPEAAEKGKVGPGRFFCDREPCQRAYEQERQLSFDRIRPKQKVGAKELNLTAATITTKPKKPVAEAVPA